MDWVRQPVIFLILLFTAFIIANRFARYSTPIAMLNMVIQKAAISFSSNMAKRSLSSRNAGSCTTYDQSQDGPHAHSLVHEYQANGLTDDLAKSIKYVRKETD